jgi:hypothetical protein
MQRRSGRVKSVPVSSADHPLHPRLKRFLIWAVALLTFGYTFLDYWAYSRVEHDSPRDWPNLGTGCGLAPAQYRIGVYFTAGFLHNVTHLRFHQIFAVSDLLCTALGLACIFFLLTRLKTFREAAPDGQWSQVLLGLLLAQVYLVWTLWFQEPETMPSLAVLAVTALLCSGFLRISRVMLGISLVLVAVLGATIRADAITALLGGMFLVHFAARKSANGRSWVAPATLVGVLAALGTEWLITHRMFPHAVRSAPVFQLLDNLHAADGAAALACVLGPWVLTIWLAAKTWKMWPVWLQGVALGSVFHFIMFLTFGMSEEVRIFLPFTLTLIPLSAPLLYGWFRGEETAHRV